MVPITVINTPLLLLRVPGQYRALRARSPLLEGSVAILALRSQPGMALCCSRSFYLCVHLDGGR